MLRSFVIDGFRTFEHLHLAGLGAVNLITGRNNVGKTVLLEALRLYGVGGDVEVAIEQLRARDEVVAGFGGVPGVSRVDVTALFHGRPSLNGRPMRLVLADAEERGRSLQVRAGIARRAGDPTAHSFVDPTGAGTRDDLVPALGVQLENDPEVVSPVWLSAEAEMRSRWFNPARRSNSSEPDSVPFVPATGISRKLAAHWWDTISLTAAEERVLACLQIVVPVEKIALVSAGDPAYGRSFVFKLRGEGDRVPMRALGDGVGRMFWMALALEIARDGGMLLIDEVENGIHYSVLPDLWRFVLRAAAAQGVQVFATTHSWDCIEAFQTAVNESSSDGALIRLTRRGNAIEPTVFNREELAVATRGEIELR